MLGNWVQRVRPLVLHVIDALDNANHARCMVEYAHDHYGLPEPTWRDEALAWITGLYLGLGCKRGGKDACTQPPEDSGS